MGLVLESFSLAALLDSNSACGLITLEVTGRYISRSRLSDERHAVDTVCIRQHSWFFLILLLGCRYCSSMHDCSHLNCARIFKLICYRICCCNVIRLHWTNHLTTVVSYLL